MIDGDEVMEMHDLLDAKGISNSRLRDMIRKQLKRLFPDYVMREWREKALASLVEELNHKEVTDSSGLGCEA